MRTVLVTGFEPFGGESINPSLEAVKKLSDSPWQQVRLVSCSVSCGALSVGASGY